MDAQTESWSEASTGRSHGVSETWTESWSHGCTDGVIEQGMHRRSHGVMDAQTESWSHGCTHVHICTTQGDDIPSPPS